MFNVFDRKPVRHKQSKYFTVMLIPDSSKKVKAIKIPHWVFYCLACIAAVVVGITLTLRYQAVKEREHAQAVTQMLDDSKRELYEVITDREKLLDEKDNIQSVFKTEKERLLNEKEDVLKRMDDYEQQVNELQNKLYELESLKEEIYTTISETYDMAGLTLARFEGTVDSEIPDSVGGPVHESERADSLGDVLDMLNNRLNNDLDELAYLFEAAQNAESIKRSIPSGKPVNGYITSDFGTRRNPFTGRVIEVHEAIDFKAATGTKVKATADGVVTFSGARSGYGYIVTIRHGYGYVTQYAHNSKLLVSEGDVIEKGDVIALSGSTGRSTGPHVHYEVLRYGTPLNPRKFF